MIPLAALYACAGSVAPPTGTLLFVAETDGVPVTWRLDLVTGGARPLDGIPAPTWPADPDPLGDAALVVHAADHEESLWLVPLSGGEARRVAGPAGRIRNPAWSPDGAWITFESDRRGPRDLYRVARSGGAPSRLTATEHGSFEPALSSDGRRLAFGTSRDGNAEVYLAEADGQRPTRLTDHRADDLHPRWRPGGEELAWLSRRSGTARVWLALPSGGAPRPLRPEVPREEDLDFAWAPDGEALLVTTRGAGGELRIDRVDPDDGSTAGSLDGPGIDEQPAWSPDGRWVTWSAEREGERDLWIARADGSAPRRLLDRPGADWLPRWVAGE